MTGRHMLALVTDAFGARGGIAQYNRDLLTSFAHSNAFASIAVLARQGGDTACAPCPGVEQQAASPGRMAFAIAAAMAAMGRRRIDVIFCGHLYMMPLAAVLGRLRGVPVWLQLHGIEAWHPPGELLRWAAGQSSLVTAVSRHTRRRFLAWADIEPERVKVLANTVEERFAPGPKPADWMARHGLQGRTVLLTVSRLAASERYKGHETVLQALARHGRSHPDWVYVIAGDGDDRPRLERMARELGVAGQTRFLGHVPDSELPDLYRCADVFLMPSTGEGFGIVFLQALACGIPVIAGDSDGSRDPLQDGRNGLLIDAADPDALAAAVERVLQRGSTPHGPGAQAFARPHFERHAATLARALG